jgi:D-alanyl-D-alanine dipeptidase
LTRLGAAPTFSYGIDEPHLSHRLLLHDSMIAAGFSNCRDEWWHYSYGDAGWAVRSGMSECFYGLVELPVAMYSESERLHIEAMKDRTNPFAS